MYNLNQLDLLFHITTQKYHYLLPLTVDQPPKYPKMNKISVGASGLCGWLTEQQAIISWLVEKFPSKSKLRPLRIKCLFEPTLKFETSTSVYTNPEF